MSKIGHEQPDFDNRAYPTDSLFANEGDDGAALPTAEETHDKSEEIMQPAAEILAEHAKEQEELQIARGELYDRLIGKNYTREDAMREVDKKYPVPDTEKGLYDEEIAAARRRLQHAKDLHMTRAQKSKKLRGVRDRKGGGPPPHIAEDVRRDQGLIE